ncbi:hypothetical protein R75465_07411 [Paraburkholderia aspalathi]|nr:hypothetical protein R75465_07411 [Paraburkholderia aspalathi]
MTLERQNSEPFFTTANGEAELAAAGSKFEPRARVRTASVSELCGWQPGERLSEAVARHLEKFGTTGGCGLRGKCV